MVEEPNIPSIFNKIFLFVYVYGGFYSMATVVRTVTDLLQSLNSLAIIIAIAALVTVLVVPIIQHFVIRFISIGEHIMFAFSAVALGIGTLMSLITPFGSVLVAAGVPGLIAFIDPSRGRSHAKKSFGVRDNALILISLAISSNMLVIIVDLVSFYICEITLIVFSILLIMAGITILLNALKKQESTVLNDAIKFGEAAGIEQVLAIVNIFTWSLLPAFFLFIMRELAVASSFFTSFPVPFLIYTQMIVFFAGIVFSILIIMTKMREFKEIISLLFIITLSMLFLLKVQIPITWNEGALGIIIRLIVSFSIAPALSGIYGIKIVNLKTTFLNGLRTFAIFASSLLLVLVFIFFTESIQEVFDIVYLVTFGGWITVMVMKQVSRLKIKKETNDQEEVSTKKPTKHIGGKYQ